MSDRADCPTCGGEGGWQDDYEDDDALTPEDLDDCYRGVVRYSTHDRLRHEELLRLQTYRYLGIDVPVKPELEDWLNE